MLTNPSNPLEWILTILLFVISLGVLITLHELGHLTMAKIFKVYCQEFSIGFGPALLHVRGKGKETYFSIRAIPLGGYVSMYGEDVELEPGVNIPKTRSLDGINRWKKAAIMVAGITMNFILAIGLFFVSNVCLPQRMATRMVQVDQDSIAMHAGFVDADKIYAYGPDLTGLNKNSFEYDFTNDEGTYFGYYFIIDDDVVINEKHYVACYYPNGAKNPTRFNEAIRFYEACDLETTKKFSNTFTNTDENNKGWAEKGYTLSQYPNVYNGALTPSYDMHANLDIYTLKYLGNDKFSEEKTMHELTISTLADGNLYKWNDIGLVLKVKDYWAPFGERVVGIFEDFAYASGAVFMGIASIFTSGIQNISGIVGIFTMSASVFSSYGIGMYFYFWGLISVNLAVFNLLPFPGLDGWQLLVTLIEGIGNIKRRNDYKKAKKAEPENENIKFEEWKIPSKVKNIVSAIGIGLLLLFGVAIIILDIIRLVVH